MPAKPGSVRDRVERVWAPTKTARQMAVEIGATRAQVATALVNANLTAARGNIGGARPGSGRKRRG